MVFQLAMNAVPYGAAHYVRRAVWKLTGRSRAGRVTAPGGGSPGRVPRPLRPPYKPHGTCRACFIVDQLSSDEWGVSPSRDGARKSVCFRIAVPSVHGMPRKPCAQGMRLKAAGRSGHALVGRDGQEVRTYRRPGRPLLNKATAWSELGPRRTAAAVTDCSRSVSSPMNASTGRW